MGRSETVIGYIRGEVPTPPEARRSGIRREAMTPATLDLAERARLAINAMTEPTDPDLDYKRYWIVSFRFNPPVMWHAFADTGIRFKFMDVLPRMRMMSGSEQGLHVEQRWKEVLLHMIAPDGPLATPMVGRPYFRPTARRLLFDAFAGSVEGDQLVDTQVNGLALGATATYVAQGEGDFGEPIGRGITDGLGRLAVSTSDMAYFPKDLQAPGEHADTSLPQSIGLRASYAMWPARRLVDFYRATGYEPALELAGRLCRYMPKASQYFGPNFEFLRDTPNPQLPHCVDRHFHAHSMTILTWLEYGLASGDKQMLDYALGAFDVAKTYGEPLTGYFPESVSPQFQTCEICATADMVRIAIRLAEAGLGDEHWDAADRWVRNHFAEGQLLRHDLIYRLHIGEPPTKLEPEMTTDRVGERNVGAFAGWMSANDWVEFERRGDLPNAALGRSHGIMHCCTANAAMALYDVWRNVVHVQGNHVKINLLLNHTSRTVDVDSHVPYTGQVDIHVKRDCQLSARMLGWVNLGQVRCAVEDAPREVTFDGRRAQVGQVQAAQVVSLSFPISEQTERVDIRSQRYFHVRKGHDVVFIDPPGRLCPLYQRDHYRDNVTLWKKTTRYVDDRAQ